MADGGRPPTPAALHWLTHKWTARISRLAHTKSTIPTRAQVRAEIDQARHDEGTLQDRFETYDDTTWMRIANSLPQAANYS